jgi:hypothetical protein
MTGNGFRRLYGIFSSISLARESETPYLANMPGKSDPAPAWKKDVKALVDAFASLRKHTDQRFAETQELNRKWKDEILEHFDVRFELFSNDVLDAQKDRFGNHEFRISRLEQDSRLNMG